MSEEKRDVEISGENSELTTVDEEKMFPKKYVDKLRKECSRYRVELKKMQETYKDLSAEDIDELRTLREKVKEFETKEERHHAELKAMTINKELIRAAKDSFAVNPEQVASLLESRVTLSEAGHVVFVDDEKVGAKEVVKTFLSENLHLVSSKSKKKGAHTTPSSVNMFSSEQVSKMTQEQYKRNRDRILKTLSQTSR